MIVMGISMNPASDRATAPVVRLATLESLGREEECVWLGVPRSCVMGTRAWRRFEWATCWRRAFKPVKYRAEPKPVRRADGNVPRQKAVMLFGLLEISRIVVNKDAEPDC